MEGQISAESLRIAIIEKAWNDPEFNADLKSKPKETLHKYFNLIIPASIDLKVVEETENLFYLVIPPKIDASTKSHAFNYT